MIRIETATYGESVISTPSCEIELPSGPMQNGITYIVRPRMHPSKISANVARISAGAIQLLVGPASSSRSEQMNVRSSTRATSLGSDTHQKLCTTWLTLSPAGEVAAGHQGIGVLGAE